jgi:hypothetical protein
MRDPIGLPLFHDAFMHLFHDAFERFVYCHPHPNGLDLTCLGVRATHSRLVTVRSAACHNCGPEVLGHTKKNIVRHFVCCRTIHDELLYGTYSLFRLCKSLPKKGSVLSTIGCSSTESTNICCPQRNVHMMTNSPLVFSCKSFDIYIYICEYMYVDYNPKYDSVLIGSRVYIIIQFFNFLKLMATDPTININAVPLLFDKHVTFT